MPMLQRLKSFVNRTDARTKKAERKAWEAKSKVFFEPRLTPTTHTPAQREAIENTTMSSPFDTASSTTPVIPAASSSASAQRRHFCIRDGHVFSPTQREDYWCVHCTGVVSKIRKCDQLDSQTKTTYECEVCQLVLCSYCRPGWEAKMARQDKKGLGVA